MTRNLYGKKMFVADLIITSIWALFAFRLSLWNVWPALIYLAMRIALCFEMQRKSLWTLYSAIAFLLCSSGFIFADNIYIGYYPFKRLSYYIGAWLGEGKAVVDTFVGELDQDVKVWLTIFGIVTSLWIIGMPIIVGILQNKFKAIDWKRKWIIAYFVISVILASLIGCEEAFAGSFMLGFFVSVLPLIYWTKYRRDRRSAISLLVNYKPLTLYVLTILLLALCLYIGIDRWDFIKAIALVVMPPVFYLIICRWCNIKPLTRHAIAMAICGLLYYYILIAPEWFKIITLSLSVILALYVAIDTIKRYKSIGTGIAIFLMPIAMVAPLILGLNPYVLLETDSIEHYYWNYYASDGIFVIEKDGKYGLRDRFGLVLEPKYEKFERLDRCGRFISTNVLNGSMIADNRFGVFDVARMEFLVDPDEVAVSQLPQVGSLTYQLIDPTGKHFANLQLRGYHPETDEFISHTFVDPYHEDPELVLEENPYYSELQKELGECQHSENAGAYELCDKARVAVNKRYNQIINNDSTYRKVYDKWAILMNSMSEYLIQVTYGEPFYSMQPIQFNHDIRLWYESWLPEVSIDYDIIFNNKIYTSSIKPRIASGDIDTFFNRFKPSKPGGYNRMWNELKPAFFEWRFTRAKYAEDLDAHIRLSYEEHTDYLTNYLFKEIQGLVDTRNDNILWDNEHPNNN